METKCVTGAEILLVACMNFRLQILSRLGRSLLSILPRLNSYLIGKLIGVS